jgi:predicted nucleotidyltransferase
MKIENKINRVEIKESNLVGFPAVESFLNPELAVKMWPEKITANPKYFEQIKFRRDLDRYVSDVIDGLPNSDVSLKTAVTENFVTKKQAELVFNSLSDLLESNTGYDRLILYLPFEILPDKKWQPSEELNQAANRFRRSFMTVWKRMLLIHDVRANFVDGDVLESDKTNNNLSWVVKAAHLIPKLIEKDFLNLDNVFKIISDNKDEILRQSVADTLPVLADMGFIVEETIQNMKKSEDRLIRNMANIIEMNITQNIPITNRVPENITLSDIQHDLENKFEKIDSDDYSDITVNRKKWLLQEKKRDLIENWAENISKSILNHNLTPEEISNFQKADAKPESQQALVEGIRKAIELLALDDIKQALEIYNQFENILRTIWDNNEPSTRETLSKTYRRLKHLNICKKELLQDLNISEPKLAGPFSQNLESMETELDEIRNIVKNIESDPELSRLIFPAVQVFGSRLKGYGGINSDIDLAIFVRPGVDFEKRTRLQDLLKKTFVIKNVGEIVEFWLDENEGELLIRDFPIDDVTLGGSYWTHVLFGAIWEGNNNIIYELRKKLLTPYLFKTDKKIFEQDAHKFYLEELERDNLQYRLMHKGYEKMRPPSSGIHTPHSDNIDGESVFWDSGYRQIASKLFIRRVFLPEISETK